MKNNGVIGLFKLLSDETRVRILVLLARKELCVCQLMGVLGISQPLISRNLSLLSNAGLLDERRDGKLIFYCVRKKLPSYAGNILNILKKELDQDKKFIEDMQSLKDCHEFQKMTGKCDMKTFLESMEKQRKKMERR